MDSLGDGWIECQPLIDVLLDHGARSDERDDAATDLGDVDEPEALDALVRVGSNADENETLLETVGEAIAEILSRHPDRAGDDVSRLAPPALRAFRENRLTD